MKVNVTWSIDDNAEQAGKACAKKTVLDLVQTKIAIIFNSSKYNWKPFNSSWFSSVIPIVLSIFFLLASMFQPAGPDTRMQHYCHSNIKA